MVDECDVEVGRIEFVLLWEYAPNDHSVVLHKYEATLAHFGDRTEVMRISDTVENSDVLGLTKTLKRATGEWIRVHSMLSSRGFLEGKQRV